MCLENSVCTGCDFSARCISYAVYVLKLRICLLHFNSARLHTYTNQLSLNHFEITNQPKSASRSLFCHNSLFVICYSVE